MNFWTKDILEKALPEAKFHNFPKDFSANGIRVTHLDFDYGNIAIVRKPEEKVGIRESFLPSLGDKISALVCNDYKYFSKYNLPIIEVKDVNDVVIRMAFFIRRNYSGTVIDITGSSGKTTTTRMCYDVLSDYGASSNLNQANTNFGIAWNMTLYNTENKYWVNETSLGGGMDLNSVLTKPDIAVVTNIAPVHLKANQPLINVAIQKSKIFTAMDIGKTAIIYNEMAYKDVVLRAAANKYLKVITFGENEESDVRILTGDRNSINLFGKLYKYSDNPVPKHILLDAAIVLAIVQTLGLPIEPALEKLRNFNSIVGRGQVTSGNIDTHRKITMIDESFNANPLSMKFSLDGFNKMFGKNKNKMLILGDMAEGGPETVQQHLDLLEDINKIKPTRVLLCGEQMSVLWDKVKDLYNGKYYTNVEELLADILGWVEDDDYIFIKASHSIELFKAVIKLRDLIRANN